MSRPGVRRLVRGKVSECELEANRRVLESTRLEREGEWDAARARVEEARAQVGDNAFLSFLLDLELDCLRPVGR